MTPLEKEKQDQAKTLGQALKDHALKSRLTKDDVLAYRFASDFVPHIIEYGERRVSIEVKEQQVTNHKLNVANRALQSRVAELETAVKQYGYLTDRLFVASDNLHGQLQRRLQDNEVEVQLIVKELEAAARDGKLG